MYNSPDQIDHQDWINNVLEHAIELYDENKKPNTLMVDVFLGSSVPDINMVNFEAWVHMSIVNSTKPRVRFMNFEIITNITVMYLEFDNEQDACAFKLTYDPHALYYDYITQITHL